MLSALADPPAVLPTVYVWRPQEGPQFALVKCEASEVFFGGARGGGKTDGVLGKWSLKERRYGQHFNAIMFRRTTVSSEDAIERSAEIYGPLGGQFNEQKLRWRMPNGGRVSFRYLENVKDADEWQGRNVTDAWVEEAGQYETPRPIDRLFGVLRSAHGVPIQLILTANPGGAGQHWIRSRYGLVPFPRYPNVLERSLPTGEKHEVAVIPSRITDNKILITRDPGYVGRLHLVGSAQLVRAWLEGDWSAIEGAFFDCWSDANILAPFPIPKDWLRFRSGDWGSASPFSIGWWAIAQNDLDGADGLIPRGALVRYREWYGSDDPSESDKGLKLPAETVAAGICQREKDDERLTYGVLDPSTFREDGGPSLAERINTVLVNGKCVAFRPADNTRVPTIGTRDRRGAMGGWDHMRQRIIGHDGRPMIYCFATCKASIRTIPVLQHDPDRAEDLDTKSADHAADEWRYACMSRPWVKTIVKPDAPRDGYRLLGEEQDDSFKTL